MTELLGRGDLLEKYFKVINNNLYGQNKQRLSQD